MAETVGQHSVAAFTSPVNGTSPIDANTVKGNDNTIRSAYVDHDADPGIHVQSSTLASRPVANSAGRKWMTQDSGVIRLFYDDGTSWYEIDYLRTTGGTISGNLAITGTLAVTGVATFTAQPILSSLTASRAVFTDGSKGLVSNAITGTGDVVMSASPTLTGTITAAAATLSGTLGVSGLLTFASLKGTGATTVTNILDEDNMASDSATALATQQSIKAYVDAQVGASDALSEVLAIGNTTGANDIIVSAGQKIRTPAVAAQDGSSAITIANTTGALTLATALADSNLATISTAGKVSNSATTATSANTASAIVARDASGNFSAGTITAALTGNASTATALQTARTINGTSFDGTANITVTAAAGTLTGTTLASNVTASSLTSVGTLANLTVTNPITGSVTGSSGSTTGNAATATALQTARNINGVSFNGTADITVTAAAGTLTGTTLASGVTASSLTSVGTLSSLTVSGATSLQSQTTMSRQAGAAVNLLFGLRSSVADIATDTAGTIRFLNAAQAAVNMSIADAGDVVIRNNLTVDTNTLYVDAANDRVGIQTTSPGYPLQVRRAGGAGSLGISIDNAVSSRTVQYYSIGDSTSDTTAHAWYTRAGTATDVLRMSVDYLGNFAVDTNTLYVDAANNRVGVGTASPSTALHVSQSNSGDYASVVLLSNSANAAADRSGIYGSPAPGTANPYRGGITFHPGASGILTFHTGNNAAPSDGERMRLDASGNLGLGVTPSAWNSGYKAIQNLTSSLFGTTSRDMNLGANVFVNSGGNYAYIQSSFATNYTQYNGAHSWYTAPSGTAGNAISFTQAMTLDASGNLLVGTTSSLFNSAGRGVIEINGSSQAILGLESGGTNRMYLQTIGTNNYVVSNALPLQIEATGSNIINFATNNTERARITAAGEFLIGTTTATGPKLEVSGTARATGGINTNSGSASVANTTWTTLFTVPQTTAGKGIYSFMANYLDASDGQAFVELLVDRTYVRIASQSDGATLKLRLSGQNVQAYHNYGATVTISWGFLQIQIP